MRRTPSRPVMSHRIVVASEGVDETGYDTLPPDVTSPNVLVNGISTLNLDPDSIKNVKQSLTLTRLGVSLGRWTRFFALLGL